MSRLCMIKSIMTPDGVLGTLNEVVPDYDDDDFEKMPTLKLNFYPICKLKRRSWKSGRTPGEQFVLELVSMDFHEMSEVMDQLETGDVTLESLKNHFRYGKRDERSLGMCA